MNEEKTPYDFESSICHCVNLRRAAHALTEYYNAALQEHELSINQYSLLRHIKWIEPCSVASLAKLIRLDRTTLVRNLKVLEEAEFIEDGRRDGERIRKIRCSAKGNLIIKQAVLSWKNAQASIENEIGTEQLRILEEALLKIEKINAERENTENGKPKKTDR